MRRSYRDSIIGWTCAYIVPVALIQYCHACGVACAAEHAGLGVAIFKHGNHSIIRNVLFPWMCLGGVWITPCAEYVQYVV